MHSSTAALALALGFTFSQVAANPIIGVPPGANCMGDFDYRYETTNTVKNVRGSPVTGDFSCKGTQDCVLGAGVTFSKGVTVEVGASLGVDFAKVAGSAGVSASVSFTTETGKSQAVEKSCPDGPWVCSLAMWPAMTEVTGIRYRVNSFCQKNPSTVEEYKIQFPQKDDDGLQGAYVDICTCKNYEHWADPGHYGQLCPQDCSAGP